MVKNPPANTGDTRDKGSIPGSGRRPGAGLQRSGLESPWTESLAGCGPWGCKELDTTEATERAYTSKHVTGSLNIYFT